jgi:hypothetical protein
VGASPASGGTLPAFIGGDADATHTLTGTAEHPFWSVTRGAWVEMGALQSRETLLLAGGHTATITSVRTERLATPVAVYNFEVADWHTYHVGTPTGWVWVHNTCKFDVNAQRFRDSSTGRFVGKTDGMARQLSERVGKNTVATNTVSKHVHVDLVGKAHFDKASGKLVPTPHTQTARLNRGPNGQVNVSTKARDTSIHPATVQDIRMARRIAERQGMIP